MRDFVLGLNLALDLKSPPMAFPVAACGVSKALEWDRHFGRPAVLDQLSRRREQRVPRDVAAAAAAARSSSGQQCVALDAISVDREGISPLLVEERIDVERHDVVVVGSIAVHAIGANQTGIGVMCVDAKVEPLVVVGDVDFGLLARRCAFDGPLLHEP